ncbi:hypothetical protein ACJX0J_027620, partial [Zea mays]
ICSLGLVFVVAPSLIIVLISIKINYKYIVDLFLLELEIYVHVWLAVWVDASTQFNTCLINQLAQH